MLIKAMKIEQCKEIKCKWLSLGKCKLSDKIVELEESCFIYEIHRKDLSVVKT